MSFLDSAFEQDQDDSRRKKIVVLPARATDMLDIMRIIGFHENTPLNDSAYKQARERVQEAFNRTLVAIEAGVPGKILGFGSHRGDTVEIQTSYTPLQEEAIKALIRGTGLQMMFNGATSMKMVIGKSEPSMERACEYYGAEPLTLEEPYVVEITNFKKNFERFDSDNRAPSP